MVKGATKLLALVGMILMATIVLVACGGNGNGGTASNVDFEFHTFRDAGMEDDEEITRLTNLTELEYYLSAHGITGGEFYNFVTMHYTGDFFANYHVVFATLAGGGGDTFVVENVKSNGDIYVNQTVGILTNVEVFVVIVELPRTVEPTTFNIRLSKV